MIGLIRKLCEYFTNIKIIFRGFDSEHCSNDGASLSTLNVSCFMVLCKCKNLRFFLLKVDVRKIKIDSVNTVSNFVHN